MSAFLFRNRALAQRVEVAEGEVRIMGSKTRLLQALTGNQRKLSAHSGTEVAGRDR